MSKLVDKVVNKLVVLASVVWNHKHRNLIILSVAVLDVVAYSCLVYCVVNAVL